MVDITDVGLDNIFDLSNSTGNKQKHIDDQLCFASITNEEVQE